MLPAQEIRSFLSAQRVGAGQEFTLNVLVIGEKVSAISFPDAKGFKKGDTGFRQVSGARGEENTYSQAYVPTETGTFRIPAFAVEVSGKSVFMPSQFIEVVAGRQTPGGTLSGGNAATTRFTESTIDAFLRLELGRNTCLLGEPVKAEIKLYVRESDQSKVRYEPAQLQALRSRFQNPGVLIQQANPAGGEKAIAQTATTQKGVVYRVFTLHRCYLVPQQIGSVVLEEVMLDAEKQWAATNGQTVFRPFRLSATAASLAVKPLPDTRLRNAQKAVGNFTLAARFSRNPAKTGENVQLIVEVSGTGNTAFVPAPRVRLDERNFVTYEPTASFSPKSDTSIAGTRRFSYELTPAIAGIYTWAPIVLYYFNTASNRYDSLEYSVPQLKVEGKDNPQLVAARQLDNFYETALAQAGDSYIPHVPMGRYWVYLLMLVSVALATWLWLRQ